MKIRKVGAELFHADGDKDRHDEANSTFRSYVKTFNKTTLILTTYIFYGIHVFTNQYSCQSPFYIAYGSSVDRRHD